MVQKIYQEAQINVRRYGLQDFQTDLVNSFVEDGIVIRLFYSLTILPISAQRYVG